MMQKIERKKITILMILLVSVLFLVGQARFVAADEYDPHDLIWNSDFYNEETGQKILWPWLAKTDSDSAGQLGIYAADEEIFDAQGNSYGVHGNAPDPDNGETNALCMIVENPGYERYGLSLSHRNMFLDLRERYFFTFDAWTSTPNVQLHPKLAHVEGPEYWNYNVYPPENMIGENEWWIGSNDGGPYDASDVVYGFPHWWDPIAEVPTEWTQFNKWWWDRGDNDGGMIYMGSDAGAPPELDTGVLADIEQMQWNDAVSEYGAGAERQHNVELAFDFGSTVQECADDASCIWYPPQPDRFALCIDNVELHGIGVEVSCGYNEDPCGYPYQKESAAQYAAEQPPISNSDFEAGQLPWQVIFDGDGEGTGGIYDSNDAITLPMSGETFFHDGMGNALCAVVTNAGDYREAAMMVHNMAVEKSAEYTTKFDVWTSHDWVQLHPRVGSVLGEESADYWNYHMHQAPADWSPIQPLSDAQEWITYSDDPWQPNALQWENSGEDEIDFSAQLMFQFGTGTQSYEWIQPEEFAICIDNIELINTGLPPATATPTRTPRPTFTPTPTATPLTPTPPGGATMEDLLIAMCGGFDNAMITNNDPTISLICPYAAGHSIVIGAEDLSISGGSCEEETTSEGSSYGPEDTWTTKRAQVDAWCIYIQAHHDTPYGERATRLFNRMYDRGIEMGIFDEVLITPTATQTPILPTLTPSHVPISPTPTNTPIVPTATPPSPIEMIAPQSDQILSLDVYGWAFEWGVEPDCSASFMRLLSPTGSTHDSSPDDPYFFQSVGDDGVNYSAFLSYPHVITERVAIWEWQVFATCSDGEHETAPRRLWVEPSSLTPPQDRVGVRVVSGTVYADSVTNRAAPLPAAGVTVSCVHSTTGTIAGCYPESVVTGADGAFSFELVVHESDSVLISAEKDTLTTTYSLPPSDCTTQCPPLTLNLNTSAPTQIGLSFVASHTNALPIVLILTFCSVTIVVFYLQKRRE